eukprot:GDKI01018344.1.p1 GENE.GDKI01018344.1~~GDKI01018344.1.p1  ORF type:complete len:274 (-),score=40.33 GDKI01018344.1:52-786(-)
MFSGRWEGSLVKDKSGACFLNFDPDLFSILLNHLRAKEFAPPGRILSVPSVTSVSEHQRSAYQVMLEYLGFMKPPVTDRGLLRFVANAHFAISGNGTTASCTTVSEAFWWFAATKGVCVPGAVWRVKECTQESGSNAILVGIVRENLKELQARPGGDGAMISLAYMFRSGSTDTFVRGSVRRSLLTSAFERGHSVALSLSAGGVLSLTNETTGLTHTIGGIPMTDTYRFAFSTCYPNNALQILA